MDSTSKITDKIKFPMTRLSFLFEAITLLEAVLVLDFLPFFLAIIFYKSDLLFKSFD